ncbi:TPA: glycosyltransferase family 2 protein [Klebsiella pneumoniae]|nr:glycosyltransferase family 2 protein [Klebsiella pneumoniae]
MLDYKISVVIPYYNDSSNFIRCINSVIKQTAKPLEVIIIDDCSEDSPVLIDILSSYKDIEFEIICKRNTINMNGAFSRNRGIDIASGEFVALLDADDFWDSTHLELCLSCIVENSNADFIYSDYYSEYKVGKFSRIKTADINNLINQSDIVLKDTPQTNSFFFRRKIFPLVKFDESLRRHQDFQFLLSVVQKNINIIRGGFCSSYYCLSPRPIKKRVDFNSMFIFWNDNYHLFTQQKIDRYLDSILYTSMCINGTFGASDLISRQLVFKRSSYCKLPKLVKYIGDDKNFKVFILRLLYVFVFDVKNLINRLRKIS